MISLLVSCGPQCADVLQALAADQGPRRSLLQALGRLCPFPRHFGQGVVLQDGASLAGLSAPQAYHLLPLACSS